MLRGDVVVCLSCPVIHGLLFVVCCVLRCCFFVCGLLFGVYSCLFCDQRVLCRLFFLLLFGCVLFVVWNGFRNGVPCFGVFVVYFLLVVVMCLLFVACCCSFFVVCHVSCFWWPFVFVVVCCGFVVACCCIKCLFVVCVVQCVVSYLVCVV